MKLIRLSRGEHRRDSAYERFKVEDQVNVVADMIDTLDCRVKHAPSLSKINELLGALVEIENVSQSPHESIDKMEDLYENMEFLDDVNKLDPLERRKVILERMKEIAFVKKMGVYKKVSRADVMKSGWKIISTKWVDTNKGTKETRITDADL